MRGYSADPGYYLSALKVDRGEIARSEKETLEPMALRFTPPSHESSILEAHTPDKVLR